MGKSNYTIPINNYFQEEITRKFIKNFTVAPGILFLCMKAQACVKVVTYVPCFVVLCIRIPTTF